MRKNYGRLIFHLSRKDGVPLFLHPFSDEAYMLELGARLDRGEDPEIQGLFGREPRVESLTLFRNELYRLIEQHVEKWMAEKRFIPRFLFSAAVFLLAYFFAAVVIRDPVPLLDEILIALGASVLSYFLLGRQLKNSDLATRRRIKMRDAVDKIVFRESAFVRWVEDYMEGNENLSGPELMEGLLSDEPAFDLSGKEKTGEDLREMAELLDYLERQFDKDLLKWQEKSSREKSKKGEPQIPREIRRMKKVDLSLFFTYTKLRQFCKK